MMPTTSPIGLEQHDAIVTQTGYVPVIDLGSARGQGPEARLAVARTLGTVCETSGFFTVVGHGVPDAAVSDIYEANRKFFALPDEQKTALRSAPGDPLMRGFGREGSVAAATAGAPVAHERALPDLAQTFIYNRLGEPGVARLPAGADPMLATPNLWPDLPGFADVYRRYYALMEELAQEIMRLFALALDLPEAWFDDKIDDHMTNMVANYYPAGARVPTGGPGQAVRTGRSSVRPGAVRPSCRGGSAPTAGSIDRRWTRVRPGGSVSSASCVMARWAAVAWRVRRTPTFFSQSSMRSGRSMRTRASRNRSSSGAAVPPGGVKICFSSGPGNSACTPPPTAATGRGGIRPRPPGGVASRRTADLPHRRRGQPTAHPCHRAIGSRQPAVLRAQPRCCRHADQPIPPDARHAAIRQALERRSRRPGPSHGSPATDGKPSSTNSPHSPPPVGALFPGSPVKAAISPPSARGRDHRRTPFPPQATSVSSRTPKAPLVNTAEETTTALRCWTVTEHRVRHLERLQLADRGAADDRVADDRACGWPVTAT